MNEPLAVTWFSKYTDIDENLNNFNDRFWCDYGMPKGDIKNYVENS